MVLLLTYIRLVDMVSETLLIMKLSDAFLRE